MQCEAGFTHTLRTQRGYAYVEMGLNSVKKCKVMHICNKHSRIKRIFFLKDNKLEDVDCEKYLGVFIQTRLNWSQHTCQDSYKKLGMLKRIFSNCDISIKENLYN